MPTKEALMLAREKGLDLVEVAPNSRPPVCRIMDYGRFKYQQEKKERQARKHQTVIHIKEIKMTTRIGEHDYQVKLRNIREFLSEGNRVKVSVRYRGREMLKPELGRQVIERVISDVSDLGQPDRPPNFEGRHLVVLLIPFKKK